MTSAPDVVIVGSGFAGIAAGVKLLRAGIETFTIYEKSLEVGGTWRDNVYPGCEVDTSSIMYSYSFTRPDWGRTHARQDDLRKYLENVIDEFGLRAHIRTGVGVDHATWDERTKSYSIELDDGTSTTCRAVISAVGFLNVPRMPDWPGLQQFRGPSFHTARWEHEHALEGKRVAIVGTGSSTRRRSCRSWPTAWADSCCSSASRGGCCPRVERDFTPEERAERNNPWRWRVERLKALRLIEKNLWHGGSYRPGRKPHTRGEAAARAYIERSFEDRPDLREAVTPAYPYWGKRVIFATTFYPR